jgi:hypothetical protein
MMFSLYERHVKSLVRIFGCYMRPLGAKKEEAK